MFCINLLFLTLKVLTEFHNKLEVMFDCMKTKAVKGIMRNGKSFPDSSKFRQQGGG